MILSLTSQTPYSKKRSKSSVWKCNSVLLWEKITNFFVSQSMVVKLVVFFTIIGEFDHRSLEMNLINQHFLENYSIFLHEVIVSHLPAVICENFIANSFQVFLTYNIHFPSFFDNKGLLNRVKYIRIEFWIV